MILSPLLYSVLSLTEKRCLLRIARQAIEAAVAQDAELPTERHEGALMATCGAFVTLHKNHELRGCIGFIDSPRPLVETVKDAAVRAALEDPRFEPVTPEEIDLLEIEISVLSPPRRIENETEIEIGTHGLIVEAMGRRGLLLPQVATEHGWDREMFLQQTLRKAGVPDQMKKEMKISMYVFSAEVFDEHMLTSTEIR